MDTKFAPDVVAAHLRGLSGYNSKGEEIPDPTPVELPVGFTRPKTLQETMRDLLRNEEVRRALDKHDMETFEEADDFDIPDDAKDPRFPDDSPYEQDFDPEGIIAKEQAIKSGFVEEIPLERKQKAAVLHEKIKKHIEESRHPPKKKIDKSKKKADIDADEDEDD